MRSAAKAAHPPDGLHAGCLLGTTGGSPPPPSNYFDFFPFSHTRVRACFPAARGGGVVFLVVCWGFVVLVGWVWVFDTGPRKLPTTRLRDFATIGPLADIRAYAIACNRQQCPANNVKELSISRAASTAIRKLNVASPPAPAAQASGRRHN